MAFVNLSGTHAVGRFRSDCYLVELLSLLKIKYTGHVTLVPGQERLY